MKYGRKKILMIIGSLDAGGKERQLIALLKGLLDTGLFTSYIGVMNSNGLRESEASEFVAKLIKIERFFRLDFLTPMIHLVKLVREEKIQLVHTWGSGIWDLIGCLVAQSCQVPFLHGGIRSAPVKMDISDRLSQWAAKHADAIVANSRAGLEAFGFDTDHRSQVIHNGLDFSRFAAFQDSELQDFSICMVANFSPKKDHHSLIAAMPILNKTYPKLRAILVGHDAGSLRKTISYAEELGVRNQIKFVTDTLNPEPYIARCQIGVLASNPSAHGEGTSNAILEYMALGKPVIATDNGGNREVVVHGQTGFLVPPRDPGAIASQVIDLLNNQFLSEKMGQAGKLRVMEKFSLESLIRRYVSAYESLIL